MTSAVTNPDWSTIGERIACPLCDYELRGLVEPRCPECGHQFTWDSVLNPEQRHPYLFEHYPHHKLWSYFRTKFGAMAPWSFWRTLKPTHVIVRRRLILYWMICAPMILLALPSRFIAFYFERVAEFNQRAYYRSTFNRSFPSPWTRNFFEQCWRNYWGLRGGEWRLIAVAVMYLLWPRVLYATLMIFQHTMRRAKIKPGHVERCVIYSCDNSILIGLAIAWAADMHSNNYGFLFRLGGDLDVAFIAAAIIAVITATKLGFAYLEYLRFPQAVLTVLLSEVVVMLAAVTAMMVVGGFF